MSKFKLARTYLFTWPVKVETPDPENPGKLIASTMKLRFESYPQSRLNEIENEIAAKELKGVAAEIEFLKQVIKGWDEIEDEDGNDLAFTDENLTAALQHTFVRGAAYRAYFAAINGRAAEVGN